MGRKSRNSEGCSIDMTPMIDVVFQLIIFFIVTITISEAKDEEVLLELGPKGEIIETGGDVKTSVLIIDIGPKGKITVNNKPISNQNLRDMVTKRLAKSGKASQIWIRGDRDVPHQYVRHVMDICTESGVSSIHFIATKDVRSGHTKDLIQKRNTKTRR